MKWADRFVFAAAVLLSVVFIVPASAAPSRVFWSPDGQNLGSPLIPAYVGDSPVVAMIPYKGGILTAFANAGPGYRVHWSSDGESLGSGEIRYEGTSPVTAMIPFNGGVLTAFSEAGGQGNKIFFSPDGNNLGASQLVYEGSSPVTALAEYGGGVMAAFSNAGGNGNRIWFSTDYTKLGQGTNVYDGSSPVVKMMPYGGGLLTAFSNAGKGFRIHWSADGRSPGGGDLVYDGSSPITAMAEYGGGVLVAFSHTGLGNTIYWTPNQNKLGTGTPVYDGSTGVSAMLAYDGGMQTAFIGESDAKRCDAFCGVGRAISEGVEPLRETGRLLDKARLKLQKFPEHLVGEALAQAGGRALAAWLEESRDSALPTALEIPENVKAVLREYYDDDLINSVRYKVGDGGVLNLANDIISYGSADAVSLINVIVFKGPSEAADLSTWIHEMKHMQQFRDQGVKDFSIRYVRSKGSVQEDPAYAIQAQWVATH